MYLNVYEYFHTKAVKNELLMDYCYFYGIVLSVNHGCLYEIWAERFCILIFYTLQIQYHVIGLQDIVDLKDIVTNFKILDI